MSSWSITILGGRGWTEPAKETPVRSTSRAQIQVERSNHVPGVSLVPRSNPGHPFFDSLGAAEGARGYVSGVWFDR